MAGETAPEPRQPAPRPVPAPPAESAPSPPPAFEPPRRRRVVAGLAAEAAAQVQRRSDGLDPREPPRRPAGGRPVPAAPVDAGPVVGTCGCGLPARARCADGCGRPVCGHHLLNGGSRLAAGVDQRSERERTAYVRAFSGGPSPRCTWCREAAGDAAVAALGPTAPLPADVLERLRALLARPHDHPRDAWDSTVRRHGGPAAVARLLAPRVARSGSVVEFGGRRGEVLAGVSVGRSDGRSGCEVLDPHGSVWSVRVLGAGLVRRRPAWVWAPVPEERLAELLPRIVELAAAHRSAGGEIPG